MRDTRQRRAVTEALKAADGFRSAQELCDEIRTAGKPIGLATVYRTLQAMEQIGEVDSVRGEDGEVMYRRCDSEHHHHHLVCRRCGFSVEVDNDEVERWAERSARKHGFVDVTHDIEIFGVCERCG